MRPSRRLGDEASVRSSRTGRPMTRALVFTAELALWMVIGLIAATVLFE
jgi:hypothetical protein